MVKLYILYALIRKLTMPYKNWAAYKLGIIDDKGNTLIKTKDFTNIEQRKAWTHLDIAARNMRKLLSKFPLGSKLLGSYAAALWLIKESEEYGLSRRVLSESYIEREIEDLVKKLKDAGIDKILGEDEAVGDMGIDPTTNQTGHVDGYDMPLIPYLSRKKPKDKDDLNEEFISSLLDRIGK